MGLLSGIDLGAERMAAPSPILGASYVVTAVVLGIILARVLFSKHKNLPPGPRGLPFIGALHLLGTRPHVNLAKLSEKYGPVMSLWLGQRLCVVASSPEATEEFLKVQGSNFASRPKTRFSEMVFPKDIGFNPVDTSERRQLLKLLKLHMSTGKQLQESEGLREEEIAHVLRLIPSQAGEGGAAVVPVKTYMEVAITNIISRMVLKKRVMGESVEGDEAELHEIRKFRALLEEAMELGLGVDPGDFIPVLKWIDMKGLASRYRNLKARMDSFMSNVVSQHLVQRMSAGSQSPSSEIDMVDVFLDQMEDETLRCNITEQHVRSSLWNSFLAGTGTTLSGSEWAMAECVRNPDVMKKVQAELDAVVGKSRRVEAADIPNLKYLHALIKETLRLHPPVPLNLPHENVSACKAFGYDIPAGTMLLVNVYAMGRDASIWENPLEFKPERFLEGMPHANTDVWGHQFGFVPFGSGRRSCPGIALAMAVMQMLTATLLQAFDWSLPNNIDPKDLDMSGVHGGEGKRAQPLIAVARPRLPTSSLEQLCH